jgi:hypothetical protein
MRPFTSDPKVGMLFTFIRPATGLERGVTLLIVRDDGRDPC